MVLEFSGYSRGGAPTSGSPFAAVICHLGSERLTLAFGRHEAEAPAHPPDYVAAAEDLWRIIPPQDLN